jgi:hypothetical protein
MKVLGERISILKKEKVLSIVILPGLGNKKLLLIFTWLLAWSVCGVVVFMNYFATDNKDLKLFILVYLSFWAYFEFSIARSFIWKKWGKEKLWIQNGIFHYQREVNKKGKIREWNLELMSKVELVELKSTRLADTLSQSFWMKGGERLEFTSQGKIQRLAMQVTDQEAAIIRKEVNLFIP